MKIDGKDFKIIDTFDTPITVPDCIVAGANKLGSGHGEAKFYLGSKYKMREFYGGEGFTARCFVLKSDLWAYMQAMKTEYLNPSQGYRKREEMPQLWHERMEKIAKLPEVIEFNITDQTQIDGSRGYVNSSGDGYQIIRTLALPLVSYISAMQLNDKGNTPIYYWKLFADFDAIQDKTEAQVFTYGKGKKENTKPKQQDKKAAEIRRARDGQGKYREMLLEECPFCPITMINDERLLIASHIKPWAVANDAEKIDPKNGLMLSPLYDKLFDRGFMTFTPDRRIQISNWLSPQNQKRIGVKTGDFVQLLPLTPEREIYLEYHRTSVFKG